MAELNPVRNPSRTLLFQVVFQLWEAQDDSTPAAGLRAEPRPWRSVTCGSIPILGTSIAATDR